MPQVEKRSGFDPAQQMSKRISDLLYLAETPGRYDEALQALQSIQLQAKPPLSEEAAFRRMQLMLRHDDQGAQEGGRALIIRYPEHALVPYVNLWLAQWADQRNEHELVLSYSMAALQHQRVTAEVARQAIDLGLKSARQVGDGQAVEWFFAVSDVDFGHARDWMFRAAERASLPDIKGLSAAGRLAGVNGRIFLQHAARYHLRIGDMEGVRAIAAVLSSVAPGSSELSAVQAWASGNVEPASIGVLLPLTGSYGRFGEQALRGIRLAISIQRNSRVSILVEDTAGSPQRCHDAYQALLARGVDMIIGPLLSTCIDGLSPGIQSRTAMMTLTSREGLASRFPWLFSHSLSLNLQADFMARHIMEQGALRLLVIHSGGKSSQQEATAFSGVIESLGGEVAYDLELPGGTIDYRSALRRMREATDDEVLLARLDEERALFGDSEEEIRLPVNFDGVYLALPGRVVSLLAGQLAYIGVVHVPFYGSSRWQDGHLLADRGRYLAGAQFSNTTFPHGHSPETSHVVNRYREVWGEDAPPTSLLGLAYDSTLIATMLTSRLGMKGQDVIRGLRDELGFSGVTGHVRFDREGIGRKRFDLLTIDHGKITPAAGSSYLSRADALPLVSARP